MLRAHVGRCPDAHPRLREGLALDHAQRLADAEIRDQRMPVLQHDVLGLDVAVHDSVTVRVVERPRDFGRDAHRLAHREQLRLIQSVAHRAPLDAWHHVVQRTVGLTGVVEWEDMRVRELRREPDLAQEPVGP